MQVPGRIKALRQCVTPPSKMGSCSTVIRRRGNPCSAPRLRRGLPELAAKRAYLTYSLHKRNSDDNSKPFELDKLAPQRQPPRLILILNRVPIWILSAAFLLIAVKLASPRAFLRLESIANQLRLGPRQLSATTTGRSFLATMAAPNYANPPQAPVTFKTTADAIRAETKQIIDGDKKTLDKIVAEVTPETATFDNVFKPYLSETDNSHGIGYRLSFYQSVSPDKALRDASTEAEAQLDEYSIDSKMREDVFKLVDAVYQKREAEKLDAESVRIVEKEREQYIMNGLLLPAGPKRDRFKEIKKRLSQLQIEGNKNLNEEMGGLWVEPAKLAGVPKDDIDPEALEKGTGENEGKVKVSFKYNHQLPLLKYCADETTRRDYMIAESNRVSQRL